MIIPYIYIHDPLFRGLDIPMFAGGMFCAADGEI